MWPPQRAIPVSRQAAAISAKISSASASSVFPSGRRDRGEETSGDAPIVAMSLALIRNGVPADLGGDERDRIGFGEKKGRAHVDDRAVLADAGTDDDAVAAGRVGPPEGAGEYPGGACRRKKPSPASDLAKYLREAGLEVRGWDCERKSLIALISSQGPDASRARLPSTASVRVEMLFPGCEAARSAFALLDGLHFTLQVGMVREVT